MESKIVCFFLVLHVTGIAVDVFGEYVYIEDLNSDHDRRHLDAGLPSHLEFNVKRGNEAVRLSLEENVRLNANAPVYEINVDAKGRRKVVKKKAKLITDTHYYHDKHQSGTFAVRCLKTASGPCARTLGLRYCDGYAIQGTATHYRTITDYGAHKAADRTMKINVVGNLFIDGVNFDIEPSADAISKRGVYLEETRTGIPHHLTENRVEHSGAHLHMTPSLEIPDELANPELDEHLHTETHEKTHSDRKKRATETYAVEVLLVIDPTVWKRYYDASEAVGDLTREDATELAIREHYSLIINGVSLRYESIEDPDMQMYVTVSGFLFLRNRDSSNPLPLGSETVIDGIEYADAAEYLGALPDWTRTLQGLPENNIDHIMTFTKYDLYRDVITETGAADIYENVGQICLSKTMQTLFYTDYPSVCNYMGAILLFHGIAFTAAACGPYKVSVLEEREFFRTTTVASHELGHSVGSSHDGSGTSTDCSSDEGNIMAPSIANFRINDPYNVNPWRFSQCSIDAIKEYITNGVRENCFTNPGEVYNQEEYLQHTSKLPGELHTAEEQCKLLHGDISRICTRMTDPDMICRFMYCFNEAFTCTRYTAARGTECGGEGLNKWCIEGNCTVKAVVTTTPLPTEPPTTTPQHTFTCPGDAGFGGFTCDELKDIHGTNKLCKFYAQECCGICGPKCNGDKGITISGTEYTCENALTDVFESHISVLCRVAGKDCCSMCT